MRELLKICCPRFPCVVQQFKFYAGGDSTGVAELFERPVPHDNMVLFSDEFVESVICHACESGSSQGSYKYHV